MKIKKYQTMVRPTGSSISWTIVAMGFLRSAQWDRVQPVPTPFPHPAKRHQVLLRGHMWTDCV